MSRLDVRIRRKIYSGAQRPALEDLHLEAGAGELVAVVGPSGAGKSTLLGIVGGIDPDVDGEIRVNGESRHPTSGSRWPIAMMFQSPRLMPWLTVLDNLRLVVGNGRRETARARALLADVGLTDWENAYPGQLSGGMQRRVALARAFLVHPSILLLDEPFVSLDAPTAARLRAKLLELWEAARPTVLYVTHDLREALAMADRVLFLSGSPGRVVLSLEVGLERPREPDDPSVNALREEILAEHPDLLSGLAQDGKGDGAPSARVGSRLDSG